MLCINLCKDDIDKAEGPRSSNSSTTVDDDWSRVRAKTTTVTNSIEKLQKYVRILRDTKVRPVGVVEVHDYTRFIILKREREKERDKFANYNNYYDIHGEILQIVSA